MLFELIARDVRILGSSEDEGIYIEGIDMDMLMEYRECEVMRVEE